MSTSLIFGLIASYFFLLLIISLYTGRKNNNVMFFLAGKNSPWFVVAFGMIGASLSGVTFISIPGVVGAGGHNSQYAYMQMVAGYTVGYFIIAYVLLPLYYRLNLTSIYAYLQQRFGGATNKVSSLLFIVSRTLGAAIRLYLVVLVLQYFLMDDLGVSFYTTTGVTILLIWLYTFRGGIKTVVWTDLFQTACMLMAVVLAIIFMMKELQLDLGGAFTAIKEQGLGKMFFFEEGWKNSNYFWKHFIGGIFITIVMTGLDQDMMQKNLSCRNLKDAQKNVISLGLVLLPINLVFLTLGALMYVYINKLGLSVPTVDVDGVMTSKPDLLFPYLALEQWGGYLGIIFIIGLIAAAYSSADSTLTALTTSFSIDILGVDPNKENSSFMPKRYLIHFGFSLLLFVFIAAFKIIDNDSVINSVFKVAGYTYGPLLGFFAFGLLTHLKICDEHAWAIALISPLLTGVGVYLLAHYLNYKTGFELVVFNGLITFGLLWLDAQTTSLSRSR